MRDPEDERARTATRIRSVIDRLFAESATDVAADGTRRDVRTVSITVAEGEALTR